MTKYANLEMKAEAALKALQELEIAIGDHPGEWDDYKSDVTNAVSMMGRMTDALYYERRGEEQTENLGRVIDEVFGP